MPAVTELLSTGSELLDGRTLNTHGRTLGTALAPLGLRLGRETTLPDDAAVIRAELAAALKRSDVVFMSGGLGPTSDDLTRDLVAGLLGRRVVMHEPTRAVIHGWLKQRNRSPTESIDRHALVVEGAEVLANRSGLAPGERLDVDGRTLFLLPGPPGEFRCILEDHVLPWLRANAASVPPLCRSFRLSGPGESEIIARLLPLGFPGEGIDVAYCARAADIEVRLWAPPAASDAMERAARLVRESFPDAVYAETDGREAPLEKVVGEQLRDRKFWLATAESCTGGLIAHRLTQMAGCSDYFRGGIVAYDNAVKAAQLGVPASTLEAHGAVSEQVARAMAERVRAALKADLGLATTGIAGPGGATPEKPVGLVFIAVADRHGTVVREVRTGGDREYIKQWASQSALNLLRLRLADRI